MGEGIEGEAGASTLRLDTVTTPDRAIVLVRGDVDSATAPQLAAVVESLIAEGVTELELDLAELDFLDSTGIGVLAGAIRQLNAVDGRLVLRSVPASVKKLLHLSDLERFLVFADDA